MAAENLSGRLREEYICTVHAYTCTGNTTPVLSSLRKRDRERERERYEESGGWEQVWFTCARKTHRGCSRCTDK